MRYSPGWETGGDLHELQYQMSLGCSERVEVQGMSAPMQGLES
jgi:hypothetical protein